MPANRGHQLVHSDALSAELEALGLDSSIFGAVGIPAPIFQALVPRRAGVFDGHAHTFGTGDEPATFTRASDGIYLDADGVYKTAAANAIRAEYSSAGVFLGYLFEPAVTNKNSNYNDGSDVTGLSVAGDPAAVLSQVNDSEASALFGSCLSTDQVFDFDNTGGSGVAAILVNGPFGNTNTHTISLWAKVIAAGAFDAELQESGAAFSTTFTNTTWQRISVSGSPTGAGNKLNIRVFAGGHIRFVFNQIEELPVVSSPIITQGASASRAVDALNWSPIADYSAAAGSLIYDLIPRFSVAVGSVQNNKAAITFNGSGTNVSYFRYAGGDYAIASHDGVTTSELDFDGGGGPTEGQQYRVAHRWNAAGNELQIGLKNGTWNWQTAAAYDGAFDAYSGTEDRLTVLPGLAVPVIMKNLMLFNRDLTQAEITRLF